MTFYCTSWHIHLLTNWTHWYTSRHTNFLDEIGLNCYCLSVCPDIWLIKFKFLCVRDITNLRLVSQKFHWLTYLHKTVNKFSKQIFKIKTGLNSSLKEFVEELKLHFDFSELIYFNYYLSFFDSFDLDQFLLHLFLSPWSELVFNDCYFCSMILIDGTEASLEFFNSAEH